MKPIKVVMSAFGSYSGVMEIDFEKVNHGLFLITGDTGAGKTTIFDAITYALFDQTSGGKRDGKMMRSQYVSEDIETFVEFTFDYHGKRYKIRRNLEFMMMSKKRNKDGEYWLTPRPASVELMMPDGLSFHGKKNETDTKIIEIIGLDANQFTQIAMIAQGDFRELLHAKSDDRKKIFSKIFNTKIYWHIQDALRNQSKTLYGKLEDNKKICIHEMESVECVNESIYTEQWNKMPSFSEVKTEEIIDLLDEIIEEAKQKELDTKILSEQKQVELESIRSNIKNAENINTLFDKLDCVNKNKNEKIQLKNYYEKIAQDSKLAKKADIVSIKENFYLFKEKELQNVIERIEILDKWLDLQKEVLEQKKQEKEHKSSIFRKTSPEINQNITRLSDSLPKYKLLSQNQKNIEIQNKAMKLAFQRDVDYEKSLSSKKHQIQLMQEEQEQLKDSHVIFVGLEQSIYEIGSKIFDLSKMQKSIQFLNILTEEASTLQETVKSSLQVFQLKSKHYEQRNADFITEQVGIIATTLVDGKSCPVCGSMEHPKRAILSDKAVTQRAVDEAKQARDMADDMLQKDRDRFQQKKQKCEAEQEFISREGMRLISDSFNVEKDIVEVSNLLNRYIQSEKEKKAQLILAENKKQKFESNKSMLIEIENGIQIIEESKKTNYEELKNLELSLRTLYQEEKSLKEILTVESEEQANALLLELKSRYHTLEKEMKDTEESYQKLQNDIGIKSGKLEAEEIAKLRLLDEKDSAFNTFHQELLDQNFSDIESYHSAKQNPDTVVQWDRQYQEYNEELIKINENIKNYTELTKGRERIQTLEMIENERVMSAICSDLGKQEKIYYGIRNRNDEAAAKIKKYIEDRKKLSEEYTLISRLDKTANGNLRETAKLDFQTYVQRRYFESIIQEANKRLVKMTSNQFILQCRSVKDLGMQGSAGLDLDVYSMVTDSTRDVKTLSGGESFMAALAMALGMADVIQNTAGKVHMDMMFIDEGFGSLDENSRIQAISILNDLAGDSRLVGIISHVTELKEQIGRKLVVSKSEKGSSIRWDLFE